VLRFFSKEAQNDRVCGFVILSLRRICTPTRRFFANEAQNDRVCGFVILNAVKDLAFFILRFFAKEAQNDRMRALNDSRRWHSMPNLSSNLPDPLLEGGIKGGEACHPELPKDLESSA